MPKIAFIYNNVKTCFVDYGSDLFEPINKFAEFLSDCGYKESEIKSKMAEVYLSLNHNEENIQKTEIIKHKIFDCN